MKRTQRDIAVGRSGNDMVFDGVNAILLIAIALLVLYPLYFTVIASISNPYAVSKGQVYLWPKGITLEPYANVFKNNSIWIGYGNSILYGIGSTLYQLALTIPAGFVLSRKRLVGKNVFIAFFMFTMYFSGGMIPSYILTRSLGLLNSRWVLILGSMSVYNLIITRTFFMNSIPDELFEAAKIDGANDFKKFFLIAVPLSGAIIAVIALYCFVGSWNGYFSALMYITKTELYPLQIILRNILILNQELLKADISSLSAEQVEDIIKRALMAEGMKYSLIFISSLPVLIAYPFVQKYFVKGVMIGAVKG